MEPQKTEQWCISEPTSTPREGSELQLWMPNVRVFERESGGTVSSNPIKKEPRARSSHETPSVASPRQRVVVTDCDSNDSDRLHGDSQFVKVFQKNPHVDMCTIVTTTPETRRPTAVLKCGDPIGQQGTSVKNSVEISGSLRPNCPRPPSLPIRSLVRSVMPAAPVDCQALEDPSKESPSPSTLSIIILATLTMKDGSQLRVVTGNEGQPTSKTGTKVPFPVTVQRMINECHHDRPSVMRWEHNGSAFSICINHPDLSSILASHYAHANFSSFQRQLNSYGWKKCIRGKFAGMYFNARFHRNKSFKELSRIPRGYKTSSPANNTSKKTSRKSGPNEHQFSVRNTTLPKPSQRSFHSSQNDLMRDSSTEPIPFHRPTVRQQECRHVGYSIPILCTPSKEKVMSCCSRSPRRDITGATAAHRNFGSGTFSHLPDVRPDSNAMCISPWMKIRLTPSRLLLSSQISRSDSCDWGCSPPVGLTTCGDILGSSMPAADPLDEGYRMESHKHPGLRNFAEISGKSVYDDGKDIPVQVHFHGSGADISPLLPKFHQFPSRPSQQGRCFASDI